MELIPAFKTGPWIGWRSATKPFLMCWCPSRRCVGSSWCGECQKFLVESRWHFIFCTVTLSMSAGSNKLCECEWFLRFGQVKLPSKNPFYTMYYFLFCRDLWVLWRSVSMSEGRSLCSQFICRRQSWLAFVFVFRLLIGCSEEQVVVMIDQTFTRYRRTSRFFIVGPIVSNRNSHVSHHALFRFFSNFASLPAKLINNQGDPGYGCSYAMSKRSSVSKWCKLHKCAASFVTHGDILIEARRINQNELVSFKWCMPNIRAQFICDPLGHFDWSTRALSPSDLWLIGLHVYLMRLLFYNTQSFHRNA